MILTTTNTIENRSIIEYKGIVFGEIITGVSVLKDLGAGFSNFFGGRTSEYEGELEYARIQATEEMKRRAIEMGANAVIGIDFDYEMLGPNNSMIMVSVSGTAVFID